MSLLNTTSIQEAFKTFKEPRVNMSKSHLILDRCVQKWIEEEQVKPILRIMIIKYALLFLYLVSFITFMLMGDCPTVIIFITLFFWLGISCFLITTDVTYGYWLINIFKSKETLCFQLFLICRCNNQVFEDFLSDYPENLRGSIKNYLLKKHGGMPSIRQLDSMNKLDKEEDKVFMKNIENLDAEMIERLDNISKLEAIQSEKKRLSETIIANPQQNSLKRERL